MLILNIIYYRGYLVNNNSNMQFRVDNITEKSIRQFLLSLKQAQILVVFGLINTCSASGITAIDKNHIARFPYCGSMYQGFPETQGRAVNAEDSELDYRWSAMLKRRNTQPTTGDVSLGLCSGSIITDR